MTLWKKIKQWLNIITTNDRLDAIDSTLLANTDELTRLCNKVKRPAQTYEQIERQRSERRHPKRHH